MDIYAPLAGRMGMQSMREELEDLAFRVLNPDASDAISRRFAARRESGDVIARSSDALKQLAQTKASRPRSRGARSGPFRSGAKWRGRSCRFEQLSDIFGFRVIVGPSTTATARSASCTRAWPRCRAGSRTISHAQAERLPLDPHHGLGPRSKRVEMQIRTARCMRSPSAAWRRTGPTRTASGSTNAFAGDRPLSLAAPPRRAARAKATTPKNFSSTPSSRCSPIRCSASRPRATDRAAARGHADRLRLCRPHPHRRQLRRRQLNGRAPLITQLRMATRSRSSAPRPRRRPPPGKGWRSPARPGRRSAAPPAWRCATNMPGLAARSCSGC